MTRPRLVTGVAPCDRCGRRHLGLDATGPLCLTCWLDTRHDTIDEETTP